MICWGDTVPHQSVLEQGHQERRARASSPLYNWTVRVVRREEVKTDRACTCVYAAATPVCPLISIDLVDHNLNDCIVIVSLHVMICHQPPGRGDGWLLASTLRLFTGADWILVAVGG